MGKKHCDHRVVLRNPDGRILEDYPFENFACAYPEFERLSLSLSEGHKLTLQHGARVVLKHPREAP